MRISDWSSDVCSSDLRDKSSSARARCSASSYWRPPCDRAHARHGRAPDVRRSPLLLRHATREHLDAFQRDAPDMVEIVETLLDEIAQLALALDDFDHDRQIVTDAECMVVDIGRAPVGKAGVGT